MATFKRFEDIEAWQLARELCILVYKVTNKGDFAKRPDEMPVFGTMAARFNDDGVTALYQAILPKLQSLGLKTGESRLPAATTRHSTHQTPIVPPSRVRYLAEISDALRGYRRRPPACI